MVAITRAIIVKVSLFYPGEDFRHFRSFHGHPVEIN